MKSSKHVRIMTATNKTPRTINRNLIFNLIRLRHPISRAELARISGLQRSTVSVIVEELIDEKWICEGEMGRLPRGRHPTLLCLNPHRRVIALDIHPFQTTIAVADIGGAIVDQKRINLPQEPKRAIQAIISAVKTTIRSSKARPFDGIGITLPGRADLHLQKLIFAPNLNWPILSIKAQIEKATGLRVEIENVANACALSEVWFGDSDAAHDLVVVNVSEGLGTGIFANGQLLRGENGMAGEFGHVELIARGQKCGCGKQGCWETTASNRAALRYFKESVTDTCMPSFEGLLELAETGDASANRALEKMAVHLGRGMRMIAAALAPGEIVVVGEITTAWDRLGPIVEAELRRDSQAVLPKLRPAYDGKTARLRSAVALVFNDGLP